MKRYFSIILVLFLATESLLSQSQTAKGIGYGLTKDAAIVHKNNHGNVENV